jgi:hypothetical protein
MKNYYLKFESQADLEAKLIAVDLAEVYQDAFTPKATLDVVGIIHKPTGKMLTASDGLKYPEMQAIDGYHANLIADLSDEQIAALPLIAKPATPHRVWAGE